MTKAEKNAMKAYENDLIAQGIDKMLAKIMAKSFVECEVVKPVVKSNF